MARVIGKTENNEDIYGVDFDFEFKDVKYQEDGKRVVSLVASTPSVDRDGDSIEQKGWVLTHYRKNPVILWAHNHDIPAIGRGNKFAVRDDQLVFDEIEFPKEGIHAQADMIFSLMQDKFIRACSVGFLPIKYDKRERQAGEEEIGWCPTNFKKQELLELSICNVGCNRDALKLSLSSKGFRSRTDAKGNLYDVDKFVEELTEDWAIEENKTVIPFKHYALAAEDVAWDGPKEVAAAEVVDLKLMCTWFDEEDAEVKNSYKLPHHQAEDKTTVWNGVKAAMGALLGARGGVDIPEDDRKGCYNHLKRHYTEFDKEPPEFKDYSEEEIKELFPETEKDASGETTTKKDATATVALTKEASELLEAKITEAKELFLAELEKAGAVLSRANKDKLKNAVEAINAVLAAAEPATVDEGLGNDDKTQPPEEVGLKEIVSKLDLILQEIKKPVKEEKQVGADDDKSTEENIPDKVDLEKMVLPEDFKDTSEDIDFDMLSKAIGQIKQEQFNLIKTTVQAELRKATGAVD